MKCILAGIVSTDFANICYMSEFRGVEKIYNMRRKRNDFYGKKKSLDFLDLLDDEEIYEAEEYADDETYEYEAEEYADDETYEYEAEEYADDEAYEYEAEEYADDEVYEYEAEEYADDEAYEYEAEEYADDEAYDEAYEYEAEEYAYDDYEEEYVAPVRRRTTARRRHRRKNENRLAAAMTLLVTKIYNMPVLDKVLMGTGAVVLAIAVVTCSVYASVKSVDEQVASFADAGQQLEDIGIVGESGLLALTDAEIAMLEAALDAPETETEEEKEQFSIGMNMTSVEKDLKVKFVNTKTGKLIKDIPFQIKVSSASGESDIWTDDDKDGIIYHKDMTPGRYEVSLIKIDELKEYTLSDKALCVTVKDKIEYKQIDVADEIKSESEVNAAIEDTAEDIVTEEVLEDTVEWVASTRTEIGNGEPTYEEVKKNTIPDPTESASLFFKPGIATLAAVVPLSEEAVITSVSIGGTTEIMVGESTTLTATVEGSGNYSEAVTWSSSDDSIATVNNGTVTGRKAGVATITVKTENSTVFASVDITVKEKETVITAVNISGASAVTVGESITLKATVEGEGDFSKEVTWSSSDSAIATVNGGTVTGISAGTVTITAKSANETIFAAVDITVKEKAAVVTAVNVSGATSVEVGKTIKLSVHVEGTNNPSTEVTWSSSNTDIAVVTDKGEVTGISAGKVKITATSKVDSGISGSLEITVTKKTEAVTIQIPETLKVYVGATGELDATITGSADVVTWKSSKEQIATVTESGNTATVTGVKAGTTTITATYGGKSATCKVTVVENPKDDVTTVLKDKNGNVIYIKDKDGKYVKATYADYFTAKTFYKQVKSVKYKYTGWQTLEGKTYFFDKNGVPVTGEQVILGAKYVFASDGALVTGSGVMGIDVSKWNGNINWNAVKNSGVSYVIIRCGYRGSSTGALIEDPMFKKNIQGANAAGLKIGIYFFTQAVTEVEAVEEASMTINLIKKYGIAYPVFIDVEGSGGRADGLSKEARTNIVNAYCKTIQNAGYKAGIYANKTWLETKLNMSVLNQYKIWLAQYNSQYTYKGKVDLWQYSERGKIDGISGNVDMNISYLGY